MVFGIAMLVAIYILWQLLIKGLLWKTILAIGGWISIYVFLEKSYDWAAHSGIIISNNLISWSIIIPSFIVLMAMAYTKEN